MGAVFGARSATAAGFRADEPTAGSSFSGAGFDAECGKALVGCVKAFRQPAALFELPDRGRIAVPADESGQPTSWPSSEKSDLGARGRLAGLLPALYPEWLGGTGFAAKHGCRFAYVVGEMARGIATARMVVAAVNAGFFGFFGSAGLRVETIGEALNEIKASLGPGQPWGANLINAPDKPDEERKLVDFFLESDVRVLSASAYMKLSPQIVRYSAAGLTRRPDGSIERRTEVFAKISRPEVARAFLEPPGQAILRDLVASGQITAEQAQLQSGLPVAEALTVEGDSGGHTDNRPLASLFHTIAQVRSDVVAKHDYRRPIFLGAAGGIGTPGAAASAYKLGADYILTGSVNQSALESGLSEEGRLMLAEADMFDVIMAPASDMFELGVKVQVLKRGTMFAVKGLRLYEIYRRHDSFSELSTRERQWLETAVLQESIEEAWAKAREHLAKRSPEAAAKADGDPKRQMALVFRRFLFMGAHWAREGLADRRSDYQIWCGPAMGAFNGWVKDSFLEHPDQRSVQQIGLNILEGAAQVTRAQQLRTAGITVPSALFDYRPRPLRLA